jgi:predicted permease
VNLSSLLIARASARTKEFAMRIALGAGRIRLFRQLLTESLVLALAGSSLGLALAWAITRYLAHQDAVALPLLHDVHIDATGLLWTLLLTVVTTIALGLLPGMKLATGNASRNLQESLKGTGKGNQSSNGGERIRSIMVVLQVALSCVLLVGAGLLLRSFINALNVDMGFDASHASAMKIDIKQDGSDETRSQTLQAMLRQVSAIPGVQVAGEADMLPLGRNRSWQFWAKDNVPPKGKFDVALVRIVTPGYLAAIGIRLAEGRDFTWQDGPKREKVVILNQAAARHFWPGKDALGQFAVLDGGDAGAARVVGIVRDVTQTSLESEAGPEFYIPVGQYQPEGAELIVRSSLPASTLAPSVLAALRTVNPGQPTTELRPLSETVDRAVSPRRFFLMLVLSFAALGLILASLGIYGAISYSVVQRTQEIGIRMALGATTQQVQANILRKTATMAVIGAAIGTLASFLFARTIEALLFGTAATDVLTYAGVVLLLISVSLLAGFFPARRASRINPMTALRGE